MAACNEHEAKLLRSQEVPDGGSGGELFLPLADEDFLVAHPEFREKWKHIHGEVSKLRETYRKLQVDGRKADKVDVKKRTREPGEDEPHQDEERDVTPFLGEPGSVFNIADAEGDLDMEGETAELPWSTVVGRSSKGSSKGSKGKGEDKAASNLAQLLAKAQAATGRAPKTRQKGG